MEECDLVLLWDIKNNNDTFAELLLHKGQIIELN